MLDVVRMMKAINLDIKCVCLPQQNNTFPPALEKYILELSGIMCWNVL